MKIGEKGNAHWSLPLRPPHHFQGEMTNDVRLGAADPFEPALMTKVIPKRWARDGSNKPTPRAMLGNLAHLFLDTIAPLDPKTPIYTATVAAWRGSPPRAVSIPRTFSDYVGAMGEVSAEYRRKAEACRRLADLSPETARKAYWIEQAGEWEQRAAKAAKRQRSIPAK
jgi:hypothetical protein